MKKMTLCITLAVVIAVLTFSFLPQEIKAVSSDEIQGQIDALTQENAELTEQMEQLESSINKNAEELADLVMQKNSIDQQIMLLNQQIDNTDQQIKSYGILIADKQEELEAAEERLLELRDKSRERIRLMEEQGDMSYWSVLFNANTFSDFLDRILMLQELNEADSRCIKDLYNAAQSVEQIKNSMENQKKLQEAVLEKQKEQKSALTEKRNKADDIFSELLKSGDEYKKLLIESEEKQEALLQQLAQKENEYDRLAYEEWLATSIPETTHKETQPTGTSNQPSVDNGDILWHQPLDNYTLVSPYGMRWHPILGIYRMHNGVDLSSPMDTPIYATRSGVVTITDYEEDGAGNYIQINHGDGYRSVYMHMTRYIVSIGECVESGQLIGYVGTTGLSDGPHLHFGISYNGAYVNPMEFIG